MDPRIVRSSDANKHVVLGIEHFIRLSRADTGGALSLFEVPMPVGAGIPPHIHTREDETFYILEGTVAFTIAGQRHEAATGTTVYGPRGIPHGYETLGGPARMLVIVQPGGIEELFAELARLPGPAPDMARLAEICGRYGISFP